MQDVGEKLTEIITDIHERLSDREKDIHGSLLRETERHKLRNRKERK